MSASGKTTVSAETTIDRQLEPARLALSWVFPVHTEPPVILEGDDDLGLVIGREQGCAVRLGGDEVSRRHAALRRTEPGVQIEDLESCNGTRVNGRRVRVALLAPGDVVRVGGWLGVVTETPGPFAEFAPGLLGGPALKSALAHLEQAAPSDLSVILEGETGTGKEVAARSMHRWSGRPGPFVAVNCAALPEGLAEAELFGYRRGAFTGADRPSPGLFRNAHRGTLLLDEVSDLPLGVQAKLLRVLEQREVQPLGEPQPVPIDVRTVVAGQESLTEAVGRGRFRADLLARLDGVTVRLPPLRQRRQDVLPLFAHLLAEAWEDSIPDIAPDLAEKLCIYDWPFNVRELVQLVRRLRVFHGSEAVLHAGHLPKRIAATRDSAAPQGVAPPMSPSPGKVTVNALVVALREAGGNVTRAACALGITRQRAYRLMEAASVDLDSLRQSDTEDD